MNTLQELYHKMVHNYYFLVKFPSNRVKKALLEEKYKRSKAEENEAKAVLQCQLMKTEMENLRKQIQEQNSRRSAVGVPQRFLILSHSFNFLKKNKVIQNIILPVRYFVSFFLCSFIFF